MGGSSYTPTWSDKQINKSSGYSNSYKLYHDKDSTSGNKIKIKKLPEKSPNLESIVIEEKLKEQSQEYEKVIEMLKEQIKKSDTTIQNQSAMISELKEHKKGNLEQKELLREYKYLKENITASTFDGKTIEGEKILDVIKQMIDLLSSFQEKHKEVLMKQYNEIKDIYDYMRKDVLNTIYNKSNISQPQLILSNPQSELINKFIDLTTMIDELLKYHGIEEFDSIEDNKEFPNKPTMIERIRKFLNRLFDKQVDNDDDSTRYISKVKREKIIEELRKGNLNLLENKELVIRDLSQQGQERELGEKENEL